MEKSEKNKFKNLNFSIEFLIFLHQYEIMKMDYQRLIDEAKDMQHQLDEQTQQTIAIDRKLNYARKMLESERKARRDAETDKAQLVNIQQNYENKKC